MQQEPHLQSTLFVLCGDHGMNDAGNHGGSSAGETSPALLFISPKFEALGLELESPTEPFDEFQYYHTVEQADIAPTLAGLLGLPIPLNSLGVFIPEFLNLWDSGMYSRSQTKGCQFNYANCLDARLSKTRGSISQCPAVTEYTPGHVSWSFF